MAKATLKQNKNSRSWAQKLSLGSYLHPRRTALIWLAVLFFGIASYSTLLRREGFPSINTPFALAQGSYFVNDAAKVNHDVATPLSGFLLQQPGVKTVQISSFANFYTAQIAFKDNIDAKQESSRLNKAIAAKQILPAQATVALKAFEFGLTQRGDNLVVSFYDTSAKVSTETLAEQARQAATYLQNQHLSLVKSVSIIDPFALAKDPVSGTIVANQQSFDAYGERQNGNSSFHNSVVIGVRAVTGADELKLDKQVSKALVGLNQKLQTTSYRATISASNAPQINSQIHDLQKSLLEGLFVVLIVGSLIIAWRASVITVLSMLTVIAVTNGLLYLAGYSLNTITLFGLILGLSLIVDDTIIMVEALDYERRHQNDPALVVTKATSKVSAAMIAATSTSVLSFAPLLFVGGILGSFVRAIPVTIISALLISLVVALVFIPFFARFLLLGKKQLGRNAETEHAATIEATIARFISRPMLWAKGSGRKLLLVGVIALLIGGGFIGGAGAIFKKVSFNIFPPSKDDNQISSVITFKPNTSIAEAQVVAGQANKILTSTLGDTFVKASYYGNANVQSATLAVNLTDFKDRKATSPQLVKQLNDKYRSFSEAKVDVVSVGAGPPAASFTVQVRSDQNRAGALSLATTIAKYLQHDAILKRPDGTVAKIKSVDIGNSSIYFQKNAHQYITLTTTYEDTDTTTLVNLTKTALEARYSDQQVASYALGSQAVTYDSGQEQQNQDSFKTLALAFPILLAVIYIVLAFQFRSLLQPLLIFLAIPFSLFGITLGLFLTNNAFSFFAALGFFALIGLSLKNTILLTDYANQARRAGLGTVDAAHEALAQRFRPLIATSLTAVVSLIPLALSSPFWEGLAVVLIFGLLSSTFLVITVFPYYYLGSEYLRQHINRRTGLGWLITTILLVIVLAKVAAGLVIAAPVFAAVMWYYIRKRYFK
ncbi:MAG: efflux RND transporter permease subunit [Patescibacteria group bacterium]|nr:efflux RND transporter permease subunit [Patescibacteria group bacterium]